MTAAERFPVYIAVTTGTCSSVDMRARTFSCVAVTTGTFSSIAVTTGTCFSVDMRARTFSSVAVTA